MSDGENNRSLAGWWTRVRRSLPGSVHPDRSDAGPPGDDGVYASKTLRLFLDGMRVVPAPVIVELAPAIGTNISFLGDQLACKLFPENIYADIDRLARSGQEDRVPALLATRLTQAPGSVDGILAWSLFDYLRIGEAKGLASQLVSMLKPGGLLMARSATVLGEEASFRNYVIADEDHVRYRHVPAARGPQRVWLGGDLEALLAPLEVVASHLLSHHQRETLLRQPTARRKEG